MGYTTTEDAMPADTANDLLAQLKAEQSEVEKKLREQQKKVTQKYREKLNARLTQLQPAVDEYNAVASALHELDGRTRSGGRTRSAKRPSVAGGKAAHELARAVRDNPGMGVAELARVLGRDKPNYLYKVSAELVNNGTLRREGKGFVLVDESYLTDGESSSK